MPTEQTPGMRALSVGHSSRSAIVLNWAETSAFAMSSIIFPSVPTTAHTLKSLRCKGNRPTPFEIMESSTQTYGGAVWQSQ